jgi:hypothetical protein
MNVTGTDFEASLYSDGPLQVGYPPYVYVYPGGEAWVAALGTIGVPM